MQSFPDTPSPAPARSSSLHDMLHASNPRVLVAAHRGSWRSAPENSLAALRAAVDQGADIVELDVRATNDGVFVLLHDPTLDRTTTGHGNVADAQFSSVRRASLKMREGGRQPIALGEWLPTLSQALEAARDRIVVNLDIKARTHTEAISRLVIAAGMADQVFLKAQIDSEADIAKVQSHPLFGRVPFVPMMHARPGEFVGQLRAIARLRPPMYEVSFSAFDDLREGLAELRRQGARLWVNTIECSHSLHYNDGNALDDPAAVWGALVELGVGAIQTDEVERLVAYLAGLSRR
jgi:glycerophosphoryl diester phosphodiesterase